MNFPQIEDLRDAPRTEPRDWERECDDWNDRRRDDDLLEQRRDERFAILTRTPPPPVPAFIARALARSAELHAKRYAEQMAPAAGVSDEAVRNMDSTLGVLS